MTPEKMPLRVDPQFMADQRIAGWPDVHPEDYCHKCGDKNMLWYAGRDDWDAATKEWAAATGREGICCPRCFADMHKAATGRSVIWKLMPHDA